MTAGPRTPTPPSATKDAVRGVTMLVALVVGLALLMDGCNDRDPDTADAGAAAAPSATASSGPTSRAPSRPAPASPTEAGPRVPDVSGVRLDLALQQLSAYQDGHDILGYPSSHDLSPRGRSQVQDENWTVVTTRPAPGQPWTDRTGLHVFVLRNAEWAWFQAHPTMPAVPVDAGTSGLTEPGGLFEGVSELMEYRYAPGQQPEYSSQPHSRVRTGIAGLTDDPSAEPAGERDERDALAQAHEYGTLTVGSLPGADAELRVGQLLTLTVRDEPREPPPSYSSGDSSVGGSYSDGDDDVNVPGWLCPTRFC